MIPDFETAQELFWAKKIMEDEFQQIYCANMRACQYVPQCAVCNVLGAGKLILLLKTSTMISSSFEPINTYDDEIAHWRPLPLE